MNVSVVIIARNEEENLPRCLAALSWCDDVLVVDDHSTDRTAAVASAAGARVLAHRFTTFAGQRNWALEHGGLRHPWVLMLDADEVVTEPLRAELAAKLAEASGSVAGFLLCRKTMLNDRWLRYSDGFPVWILRLVRRGRARFVDAGHGEVPVPPVDGPVARLSEPFLHYPFSRGLEEWLHRHVGYAAREAALERHALAPRVSMRALFSRQREMRRQAARAVSRRLPFRPWLRFLYHYVLKRGFLDGRAGLLYARMMSAYELMIGLLRDEIRTEPVDPPVDRAVRSRPQWIRDDPAGVRKDGAQVAVTPAGRGGDRFYIGSRPE